MSALETHDLTRRFDKLIAVDHVSLSIDAGEVFALVGPNGAGKTTLIKMLTTLLPASEGSAKVGGFDVSLQPAAVRHTIGYVPQLVSADGDLTAFENLIVSCSLYDIPRANRAARAREVLAFMNLEEAGDRVVKTFSGGMVRRLEIAQSMVHRPPILFLDEPTVGLDPVARSSVWTHILELRREYGTTVLLTTHLMEEVEELCDRVAIMTLGKIVAVGAVDELRRLAGGEELSMDEVFVHFAGAESTVAGNLRETNRARRTAKRLG